MASLSHVNKVKSEIKFVPCSLSKTTTFFLSKAFHNLVLLKVYFIINIQKMYKYNYESLTALLGTQQYNKVLYFSTILYCIMALAWTFISRDFLPAGAILPGCVYFCQ